MTDDGSPLYYAVAEGDDYRRVLAMTDEREKKERVFEAWVLIDDKGICDVALHKLWRPVNEERILPCRVIVENEP